MGCDVHWMSERIKIDWETKEEKWVNCDHYKLNDDYDPTADEDDRYYHKQYEVVPVADDGRNYDLFSVLADVRNYSGKRTAIAEPKGIPDDLSPQTKEEVDFWDGDGHSHTYFTLKELKDWAEQNKERQHAGYLNDEDAKKLDEDGVHPEYYWYIEQGPRYVNYREWVAPDNILDDLIAGLEVRRNEIWPNYVRENNPDTDYDTQIRIVMWFDN